MVSVAGVTDTVFLSNAGGRVEPGGAKGLRRQGGGDKAAGYRYIPLKK
jgi:hypothetical protein